jgi:ribosomal protein S18 acetylase RimI-like enzyme
MEAVNSKFLNSISSVMPTHHPSVEEFSAWIREHPLANIPGFQVLVIHDISGLLLLSLHVPIPHRKQGHGRAILNKLIEIADRHQVPILLETSEQSESFAWIQNWYIRHRFEYTGQVGDYGPYMRRDPAQAEPETKTA